MDAAEFRRHLVDAIRLSRPKPKKSEAEKEVCRHRFHVYFFITKQNVTPETAACEDGEESYLQPVGSDVEADDDGVCTIVLHVQPTTAYS